MDYKDLLRNPILNLPISHLRISVSACLKRLLSSYLEEVKKLDDGDIFIDNLNFITGSFIKGAQEILVKGLLETLEVYHNGKPAEAYRILSNTLNNEIKDYRAILKFKTYLNGESFFRMRIEKGNFPLKKREMFHIPFEKRGLIKTQRYSIPGFPCLYLGRTLYGCWEEMNRPDISVFQVVRFRNIKEISFLDLTRPEYEIELSTKEINFHSKELYHYFMTWPIIACCSIKVDDYDKSFKSEYIIPQLLLQWIRDHEQIDGIKFNSTHIDIQNSKSEGDFSNLVLPVKKNRETGFCPELKSMFELSNPISWQMYQHAIGGQSFVWGGGVTEGVDSRIPKLELIKDMVYPYSYSILGGLESYLGGMSTSPI
jgi:hypothetical protein